ncbi:hypothetical protein SODALDRAFT_329823 [Sodiomyces alkalinus F11]|uniref:Uncharacterized protein n=1 Tax=Sodiomyces alkalinus (strain CBS 110278 / VKM F-3762 / F11) TaxID=1314773 RepID=A0A3N2Q0E3_SODAK|nr:hypothetical protein SODALDRAFT_329823 [Sodiomyces alkalinus F11]ROT40156.1 hypothetical protein SODALDRAFT_329823 [Sodiomyces alkalinus F11]
MGVEHIAQSGPNWTASRCRRLLRPLQARATALRKDLRGNAGRTSSTFFPQSMAGKQTKRTEEETGHGVERKKPRRTYSQKQTSSDAPETRPAGSLVTSPAAPKQTIYQPTRSTQDSTTCHEHQRQPGFREKHTLLTNINRTDALEHSLRSLRCAQQLWPESRFQIYEGMLRDLDAIIKATDTRNPTSNPKSLLSMCLRKVPVYIGRQEARDESTLAKDGFKPLFGRSVSIQIFDELEQFGHGRRGWAHLPTLTRANALWMMKQATIEGLLEPHFACILIQYCNGAGCQLEAMDLFREILSQHEHARQDTSAYRDVSQLLRTVSTLLEGSELQGTDLRLLHGVAPLVPEKQLFVKGLSSEALGRLWTWVLESIQDPADSVGALEFASAAIASLFSSFSKHLAQQSASGMVQGVLEPVPMNIVGAVVALSFSTSREARNSTHISTAISQGKVRYILRNAFNVLGRAGASKIARYVLALALFVASFSSSSYQDREFQAKALKSSWREHARANQLSQDAYFYSLTAALGCSIAQYSGRAASIPSSSYFSEFCDRLDTLQVQALSSLRKEGAFLLAQRTHDLRDLAFAEALSESTERNPARITSPPESNRCLLSSSFTGYRWEDGISEWVTVTPLKKRSTGRRTDT